MVGLIPKLLLQTIEKNLGHEAALAMLKEAGWDPSAAIRIGTPYNDLQWQELLRASITVSGWSRELLISHFADEFIADALRRWPTWWNMAKNSRELLKLQPLIHNSFASGVADPEQRRKVQDKFRLEEHPDRICVHYKSDNQLCDLYVALAKRVATHYGDHIEVETLRCTSSGALSCQMEIRFVSLAATTELEDQKALHHQIAGNIRGYVGSCPFNHAKAREDQAATQTEVEAQ